MLNFEFWSLTIYNRNLEGVSFLLVLKFSDILLSRYLYAECNHHNKFQVSSCCSIKKTACLELFFSCNVLSFTFFSGKKSPFSSYKCTSIAHRTSLRVAVLKKLLKKLLYIKYSLRLNRDGDHQFITIFYFNSIVLLFIKYKQKHECNYYN